MLPPKKINLPKRYLLLSLAIAILYSFFIGYGIEVFHESPNYDNFCSPKTYEARNESACQQLNGTWQDYDAPKNDMVKGNCNQPYSCQENYNNFNLKHDRVVFIIALVAAIIAFIIGTMLSREVTSTGLYGGAILTLLYGTGRYWQHADNLLKFFLLGIALAILIWIAVKKLNDQKQ